MSLCPALAGGLRCELPDGHDGNHRHEEVQWFNPAHNERMLAKARDLAAANPDADIVLPVYRRLPR